MTRTPTFFDWSTKLLLKDHSIASLPNGPRPALLPRFNFWVPIPIFTSFPK